jgi:hypothetical protein
VLHGSYCHTSVESFIVSWTSTDLNLLNGLITLAEPLFPTSDRFPLFFFKGSFKVAILPHILENPRFGNLTLKSTQRRLKPFIFSDDYLSHVAILLDDWADFLTKTKQKASSHSKQTLQVTGSLLPGK